MKLSELRACDACGGPLVKPPNIRFEVIKASAAVVLPQSANRVLGLTQFFGGSLRLAEVMGDDPDVVKVVGEHDPSCWEELFFCQDCYLGPQPLPLAAILETRARRVRDDRAKAEEFKAAAESCGFGKGKGLGDWPREQS